MITNPLPVRDTQAPFVFPFPHAANADGGAVITKLWAPNKAFVVDRVPYRNVTGLAEHASNYGIIAIQRDLVYADRAVVPLTAADLTNNTLTFATPHELETGDGPVRLTTTGGAPTGLATGTDYYVIKDAALTIKLALSLDNALRGTAIDITGAGTGIQTVIDQATTKRRLAWTCTDADLPGADNGIAADTQIALTLNAASARFCEADTMLELLVSEIGTTTVPAGNVVVEGRYLK